MPAARAGEAVSISRYVRTRARNGGLKASGGVSWLFGSYASYEKVMDLRPEAGVFS